MKTIEEQARELLSLGAQRDFREIKEKHEEVKSKNPALSPFFDDFLEKIN